MFDVLLNEEREKMLRGWIDEREKRI